LRKDRENHTKREEYSLSDMAGPGIGYVVLTLAVAPERHWSDDQEL